MARTPINPADYSVGPIEFPFGDPGSAAGFVIAVLAVVIAAKHVPYLKKLV